MLGEIISVHTRLHLNAIFGPDLPVQDIFIFSENFLELSNEAFPLRKNSVLNQLAAG